MGELDHRRGAMRTPDEMKASRLGWYRAGVLANDHGRESPPAIPLFGGDEHVFDVMTVVRRDKEERGTFAAVTRDGIGKFSGRLAIALGRRLVGRTTADHKTEARDASRRTEQVSRLSQITGHRVEHRFHPLKYMVNLVVLRECYSRLNPIARRDSQ
jgi:hypothetical protein